MNIAHRLTRVVYGPGAWLLFLAFLFNTARNVSPYTQSVFLVVAVFVVLAVSLDLAAGVAGLFSLGHAALFGIGAYLNAVLAAHTSFNLFYLLPISIAGTTIVGVLVGALALRVSGLYFAITTFVLSLLATVVINRLPITGSYAGLIGPNFPDFPTSISWLGTSLVWCGGICVGIAIFVARSLRASPTYKILLAVRDSEPLARSSGINPGLIRVAIFGLSSALAGLAGWLFAFLGVVSPGQFDWTVSVNILVMVILGGINTNAGPVLGAIFINLFTSYVSISPLIRQALFGTLFIVTIVLMPSGFVGLGRSLLKRLRRRAPGATGTSIDSKLEDSTPSYNTSPIVFHDMKSSHDMPGALAIDCSAVSYRFTKGSYAVKEIDFRVKPGTIHGLIGPNGSGKSTLLNLISGHLKPESGSIAIAGHSMAGRSASTRARVGLRRTFQSAALVGELPIAKNPVIGIYTRVGRLGLRAPIWLALPSHRKTERSIVLASKNSLRELGVSARWDDVLVNDAPNGIQQLVQLAVATVAKPSILILDEPVAGLTTAEVSEMAALLIQLRNSGVTIVVVEHHTAFLFGICDEVTVLDAGTLLTTGTPAEVRAHRSVQKVYLGQ